MKINSILVSKKANNRLLIYLSFDGTDDSINKGTFSISSTKYNLIKRSENEKKIFTDFPIKIDNINYFRPKGQI